MSDVNRLKARIKEYFCKVIDESEEGFMSKENKNVLTYNKDIQKMIDEELAKEPQECKWIPCSERLPDKDGEYIIRIVKIIREIEFDNIRTAYFCNKFKAFQIYDNKYCDWLVAEDVICWQYLPQPYKPN